MQENQNIGKSIKISNSASLDNLEYQSNAEEKNFNKSKPKSKIKSQMVSLNNKESSELNDITNIINECQNNYHKENFENQNDNLTNNKEPKERINKQKISVEDFNILNVLGTGSYGKVFLVSRKNDESSVYAMKVIKKKNMISKGRIQETKNELKILSSLNFPFIVNLKMAFQNERKLYILTDYCGGGELYYHIQKVKCFNEKAAKFYISQIILIFEYLHSKKIFYKDLKPENILIYKDGYIKLVDFGLSEINSDKLNERGNLSGTAEYLSPELISLGESGMISDWYSLGILTYEILVGRPPFINCNDNQKLFACILKGQINYPKYLSEKAVDFMKKLLTKSPYKRLGFNGASEVKKHEFLSDIDFDQLLMKTIKPPFIPKLENEISVNYIDKTFLDMTPVDSYRTSDILDEFDPFLEDGFSFNCYSNNSIKYNLNLVKKSSVQSSKSRNLSIPKTSTSKINSNVNNSNSKNMIKSKISSNKNDHFCNIIDKKNNNNNENDTESECSKTEEYLFENEIDCKNFSEIKKKYINRNSNSGEVMNENDKLISKFNSNFEKSTDKETKFSINTQLNNTLYSTNNVSDYSSKDFNINEAEKKENYNSNNINNYSSNKEYYSPRTNKNVNFDQSN